jgi:hypothetical protein
MIILKQSASAKEYEVPSHGWKPGVSFCVRYNMSGKLAVSTETLSQI